MDGERRLRSRDASEAFVLWIDRDLASGKPGGLAGTVEHVGTGTRSEFGDLAELCDFLARALRGEPGRPPSGR